MNPYSVIKYNQCNIYNDKLISKCNKFGCSEYPALHWEVESYWSIPLFIFGSGMTDAINKMNKLFGKGYSLKEYYIDWINMIYSIFIPINERAKQELFKIITYKDFIDSIKRGEYSSYLREKDNSIKSVSYDSSMYDVSVKGFNDDDPIGISTDCWNIRKICKAKYAINNTDEERCRKVQLAHTALRLIHSTGYEIALLSLMLHKKYDIHPFYSLWFAYHIKNGFSRCSSDYGDLFNFDNGFVKYETFLDRFFDKKLNSYVQRHFDAEQNEILQMFKSYNGLCVANDVDITKEIFGVKYAANGKDISVPCSVFEYLNNTDISTTIKKILDRYIGTLDYELIEIQFSFKKKLFNSVVCHAPYKGYMARGSKKERIIFRDDDEIALSVLKNSKFIKLED